MKGRTSWWVVPTILLLATACSRIPSGSAEGDSPNSDVAEAPPESLGLQTSLPNKSSQSPPTLSLTPKEEVSEELSLPSGEGIRLEGCCQVTEKNVACWDKKGSRQPAMEKSLRASLVSNKLQALRFQYGRKNRMVIYAKTPAHSKSTRRDQINVINVDGSIAQPDLYLSNTTVEANGDRGAKSYFGQMSAFMDSENHSSLLVLVRTPIQSSCFIPFVSGAKAELGPVQVRVGNIVGVHTGKTAERVWLSRVNLLNRKRVPIEPVVSFTNKDGEEVVGIDIDGKLVRRGDERANVQKRLGITITHLDSNGFEIKSDHELPKGLYIKLLAVQTQKVRIVGGPLDEAR